MGTAAGKVAILLTAKRIAITTTGIAKTKLLSLYVHLPVAVQKETNRSLPEAELFQAAFILLPTFLTFFKKATSGRIS